MNSNHVEVFGTLAGAILGNLSRQIEETKDWPVDAVYAIDYEVKCWPTSATSEKEFFTSVEEFQAWYTRMAKWATLEDNEFAIRSVYEWDLGPELKPYGWLPFDRFAIDLSKVDWD